MFQDLYYIEEVRTALEKCLGVKKNEEVLIISDTKKLDILNSFAIMSASLGAETTIMVMKPRKEHGEEPPKTIATAMEKADVILMPTSKSLSHTKARENATNEGARVASMPTITKDILKFAMASDYKKIKDITEELSEKLSKSSKAIITTKKGTKLTLNLEDREGIADTGILTEKGVFGNLPAGEAYIAPIEGEGERIHGHLVVQQGRRMPQHQLRLRQRMEIRMKAGDEGRKRTKKEGF